MKSTKTKSGFTLAEALTTLVIIGVIASLTIPALNNSTNDKQYFAQYKKAVSIFAQTIDRMNAEHTYKRNNINKSFDNFKKYFNIAKDCTENGSATDCWDYNADDQGPCPASDNVFVDISGIAWALPTNQVWGFAVDTNGMKGPNKFGKDRWCIFSADKDGEYNDGSKKPITALPYPNEDYTSVSAECKYPPCYYQSAISR